MINRLASRAVALLVAAAGAWAQQPNPVTNGGFEEWRTPNVPVDWSTLGQVSRSTDAHSGQAAVLMATATVTQETGLNREWTLDSGQAGTMLTQRRGGLRFWYKVPAASDDASLSVFAIPMSDKPLEDTSESRAAFTVPKAHWGDGRWHPAVLAYDFTGSADVTWVHISPRIFGSQASLLLDDIEYVERVGPLLAVAGMRLDEDAQQPGERATLVVEIKNGGDEPVREGAVAVRFPGHPEVGDPWCVVPELAPGATTVLPFGLVGRRDRAAAVVVETKPVAPGTDGTVEFRLEPKVRVVQLRPQRFILAAGEETTVEAVVCGDGTAICTGLTGTLTSGDTAVQVVGAAPAPVEVRPGREAVVSWRVKAVRQAPRCELSAALVSTNSGSGACVTTVVIGAAPAAVPDEAGVHVAADTAWLQGPALRLVVRRSAFGFGIADLQVRKAGWETVARWPALGRVVVNTAAGQAQDLPLYGEATADGGQLVLSSRLTDADGAVWQGRVVVALREDGRNLGVESRVRCDRPRALLAFDGPMLYVGEGSHGSAKDEALFPGLEWLDRNEESSNWQVIGRGQPHQVRYVPHPNMITIPLQSVYHQGTTVGLLWDGGQRWDGEHDRPAAVFASPDRFEGRNAHLLGLFVPSVAAAGQPWVAMNRRTATTPYALAAGQELVLRSIVYARTGTADALTAMDEWFRVFGVPEPGPLPRGTPEAEVAFSMQAYLKSLWVPETREWWTSRGAGKLLSPKGRPLSFVHDLLMGALAVQDPGLAAACRARAQEVLDLVPGGVPAYVDLGFDYGGADRWIVGTAMGVPDLRAGQGDDGAWRFDADRRDTAGVFKGMDYHRLGPDEAAEVGTCSARALALLRLARVCGSPDAYEAGVKALRFMQRVRVPRAAQVWEVMVQAPDILAAAEACEACVEAYRYDQNAEWLEQARRWARAGLPFVYQWADPQRPFLQGASIPVFGASWETCSWFGRPVQWNGLRHAQAMLKLARYDHSMPWEKVARSIVVSAMHQQSTREDDIALWPDSIGAVDSDKSGWIFAPLQILETLYIPMGRQQEPDTAILGTLPERIHLSSGAVIGEATWAEGAVRATLTYPAGESGYTVLTGVDRPAAVLLDGRPLPESPDLATAREGGWQYQLGYALCVVRTPQDGRHALELRGVRYRRSDLTPEVRTTVRFEFGETTEGWLPAHALGDLSVTDGVLRTAVTGGDPYLTRSGLRVDGGQVGAVVVRMRISALTHAETAQWYWGTTAAGGYAEARVVVFPVTADGEWHEYRVPVGQHPGWRGATVNAVRLDPFQAGDPATVEVDWIRGE